MRKKFFPKRELIYPVLLLSLLVCCRFPPGGQDSREPEKPIRPKEELAVQPSGPVNSASKEPGPPGSLETILENSLLRVAMQVGYAPFEMRSSSGRLEGMDVDLAQMIAKNLGVQTEIVEAPWEELLDTLIRGDADIVISGMTITQSRNTRALFTHPVLVTGRMFLLKRETLSDMERVKELDKPGTFVAVTAESLGPLDFSQVFPNASYREFPTREAAVREVIDGRCKAYIDQEFAIRMECAKNSATLASPFYRLTYEPMAFAVRPGSTLWLNWLNNFIDRIQRDGSLERLRKKWLHDYYLDLNN